MKPPISLRVHNVLDYVHGATVALAPFLLGFHRSKRATATCLTLGLGTITYSLLTKYDYSAVKAIPLGAHMAMDASSGSLLAAAPFALGYEQELKDWQKAVHVGLGIGAWALVLLTHPKTEKQKLGEWAEQLQDRFGHAA